MNLSEYIINDIKPVDVNQNIAVVKQLFMQLTYSHVPIIENNQFIGCISENDAHCIDGGKRIKEYQYTVEHFFVDTDTNWLDILEAFAQHNTNIMPILKLGQYVGYYELKDIIGLFDQTPFFYEPGAILVVEKANRDYSFSEISQIVESNEGKLLGVFISKNDGDLTQLTLKIGDKNLPDIMQTFRRYSYTIIAGHVEENYLEDLKDRSDYLRKYLNI